MRPSLALVVALLAGCELPGRTLEGVWDGRDHGQMTVRGDSVLVGTPWQACVWEPFRVRGDRLTRGDFAYVIERRTPAELVLRPDRLGFWQTMTFRKTAGLPITTTPFRLEHVSFSTGGYGMGGPFSTYELELDRSGALVYVGHHAVELVGRYRAEGQQDLFGRVSRALEGRLFEVQNNRTRVFDAEGSELVLRYNGKRYTWEGSASAAPCEIRKAIRELLGPLALTEGDSMTLPLRPDPAATRLESQPGQTAP